MNRLLFFSALFFGSARMALTMELPPSNLPDDPVTNAFIEGSAVRLGKLKALVAGSINTSEPLASLKQYQTDWTNTIDEQILELNKTRRQVTKICKAAFRDRETQRQSEEAYRAWLQDGGEKWSWLRGGGQPAFGNIKGFEAAAVANDYFNTPSVAACLVWYSDAVVIIDDFMERSGYDSRGGAPGGGDANQVKAEVDECKNQVNLAKVIADSHTKLIRSWKTFWKNHDPARTAGHQTMFDGWGITEDSVFFQCKQDWLDAMKKNYKKYVDSLERLHVVWDPIEMETFIDETETLTAWSAKELPRGMNGVLSNHKQLLYKLGR